MHPEFTPPTQWAAAARAIAKIGLLVTVAAFGADATMAQNAASRFREYDGAQSADVSRLLSARAEQTVKVVVVMSENSVAGARALSPTHTIGSSEHDQVVSRVRAQHDIVRPQLEGHGAKVLGHFHSALNGIKIEVHPSKIAAISAIPGVVKVLRVARHQLNNAVSVPYIGAPAVWQATPGFRGEGVKVAIIDTGIDYTHANFGGPGTPAAFAAAAASSTAPADPALFGQGAPKVKGGIDLVGDDYDANPNNATYQPVPHPDPNPLDCYGHGSHVAGTAAGFGVTGAGTTYTGPYNAAAYTPGAFSIGPGVAPKADLYAVRVFGCAGSTDVVVEAIDWAVANDMDVISMSLGSDFGAADTADALAAQAATAAGVVVVAASGNAGPAPYITSSPASGDGVISVAAIDGRSSVSGVVLTLTGGQTINAQDSNGAALPSGVLQTVVLRNPNGTISLGCSAAEYAGTAGKLVVTKRGSCARVDRAKFGQDAGAAAVAMINNAAGYGIYEGSIAGVTIPFLGVQPSDTAALVGSSSESMVAAMVSNPVFAQAASFSSGGPRVGDSNLKPSVAAPGVSVVSTAIGSGNGFDAESGTSMATPHVAGVAALTTQAHPGWSERALAAAITQTADPLKLSDYATRIEGSGLVQPVGSTTTQTVVSIAEDPTATAISFGFAEFTGNYEATRQLRITNQGHRRAKFNIAATPTAGAPHTLTLSDSSITVDAGETESVKVTLSVPGASAGDTSRFNEVAGLVTLTPATASDNNGVALNLPYYLVERSRSKLTAELVGSLSRRHPSSNVRLSNGSNGALANADFYAWGLAGTRQGAAPFDIRAVGVQSFPISATDNVMVFAVNTFDRFNTAAIGEVDLYIDTNGDGVPDFDVFSYDLNGDGQPLVTVFNLHTNKIVSQRFYTDAPTDGSTLLLPVYTFDLGLSASSPRFSYQAQSWNWNGATNVVPGAALFNAYTPAISNGDWVPVAPGATALEPAAIDTAEWAKTPALGLMIVDKENRSGGPQAALLRVSR